MATEERSFGGELRGKRAAAGMNQAELGALVGVSGSAIGNWERGEDEPSRDNVATLERALGLDPGELSRLLGYEPAAAEPPTWEQVRDLMAAVVDEIRELRSEVERLRGRRN